MKASIPIKPLPRSRFLLHKGCDYIRSSEYVIRLWRTVACSNCGEVCAQGVCAVPAPADEVLTAYGLNKWVGPEPAPAYMPFMHGPWLCGLCLQTWRDPDNLKLRSKERVNG